VADVAPPVRPGWVRLYGVNTDGTLGFLKTLNLGEPSEPNWHPTDPNKIYNFDNDGGDLLLQVYDTSTDVNSVVVDLTTRVQALFPGATGMWTKQEGRPSNDGNVWCLEVGHTMQPGSNFVADGFIAYNLQTNTIVGSMPVTDNPDHISTSPSGQYCVASWGLGQGGTRAYRTDFSTFTQLHDRSEHSDLASTAAGEDVLVYSAYDGDDGGSAVMVRLSDGARTPLFPLYGPNSSATSMHFSGTAKNRPGYVVVSFYGCRESGGDCNPANQWFVDKVVVV